jgi:DNA-directed RNA polymerase alpha subunit
MITEKQFLDAVKTIEEYQNQINTIVLNTYKSKNKTPIRDWRKDKYLSVRLERALSEIEERGIKFIEDIKKTDFLQSRNIGRKTLTEFCDEANIDVYTWHKLIN